MARTRLAAGSARRLLTKFRIVEPPVDVEEIATGLGLKVIKQNFPNDISGVLVRSPHGAAIGINSDHAETRQRFSIAHELGHFTLHPDSVGYYDKSSEISADFRSDQSLYSSGPKEREANQFAAELLMPRRMVIRAMREGGITEASELARLFNVSEQAMTYRLANIRIS